MHEYVQKLTRTTFPHSALLLSGAELSQATTPLKSGIPISYEGRVGI